MIVLFMAMHTTQVFAHTLWKPGSITPPRSTDKFSNLKFGPCGGSSAQNLLPRGTKPKVFRTGESITVEWIETINHVGLFLFNQLDNTNTAIPQFIIDNTPAGVNEVSVVDPDDGNLSGGEKQRIKTLTLSATECTECALQIIQEMWPFNATQRPTVASGGRTYYYSCSDIRIESSNSTVPGEITFPTTQARIENINNIVLNWINPSEIDKTPTGRSNVAYRVLILQSDSPIFAAPLGGMQYDLITNNTIGNAKVVYDGNLETATLSPLPNTPADKQYFKLFTYNVSNLYSLGVESSPIPGGQVTPTTPVTAINETAAGGCSVANNGKFDPLLLLLVLLSIASIGFRARKQLIKLSK